MRTLCDAKAWLLAAPCLAMSTGLAMSADLGEMDNLFVNHLLVGRGNAEIFIDLDGGDSSTRISRNASGHFTCTLFGLTGELDGSASDIPLIYLGRILHEVTHCLVSPYFDTSAFATTDIAEQRAAGELRLLTQESIADARSLLEIARQDGLPPAQRYAQFLRAYRAQVHPSSSAEQEEKRRIIYDTIPTVDAVMTALHLEPERCASAEAAFDLALQIGIESARATRQQRLAQGGHAELLESTVIADTSAAIQTSAALAREAFVQGRFENSRLTVVTHHDGTSARAHHLFMQPDGRLGAEPAFGAEGAHEHVRLKALLAATWPPEQVLAVRLLHKLGQLSERNILLASGHFAQWTRGIAVGDTRTQAHVLGVIADVIDDMPTRQDSPESADLDALLDPVSMALMRTFASVPVP
jgi:hypothetical protein